MNSKEDKDMNTEHLEHYTTDVMPFHGTKGEIYTYPSAYRIEARKTFHGWMQRHTWYWEDGSCQEDDWIKSFDHAGRLDGFHPIDAA